MYALGATCSNPGPATYLSQYNAHGNVSTRTSNNQVATLSYDPLDQMIEFTIPSGNQQWNAYDAGGTRSLQRTTSGGITQVTVYAFGLDEYHYDGSGNLQNSTHYYTLGGQLLAELSGPPNAETTNFFLTDALGSVLATFSNTAGAASMLGTQLYGPYGNERYQTGSMGTAKGFTGQYADVVTGLDYYGSRYYDPVAGVFLSADSTEGNVAGLNPYGYVGGNPETWTDPTGESYVPPGGGGGGGGGSGLGGGGGAGGGCNGSCGGSGGGGGYHHTGDGLGTAPTTVPLVIRQAEQIAAQAWDEGGTVVVQGTEEITEVVCFVECVIVVAIGSVLLNPTPLASGELSFPIRPPGPTLTYGPGVNSLALGHSMVTPNAPTTPTTQIGGSGGYKPPTKVTTSPPEGDGDGFGKLSGNEYYVSERGIQTIQTHLARPEFTDPVTGVSGVDEPENAIMLNRLMSALTEGQTISGADASFYFHELYENTLMENGMESVEAHYAAIDRYGVSPFSIYHPDAILANPTAFGIPYYEFWGLEP